MLLGTHTQVQELKGLKRFRSILHAYLGGPDEYRMFGQEIGVVAGAHIADQLGCIALTIFARVEDVESGNFEVLGMGQQLSQGVHLGIFRAGNKGGVCLPIRYHHLSFACLGVHLPADSSNSSRVHQRNQALRDLFDGTGGSFDLHLQVSYPYLVCLCCEAHVCQFSKLSNCRRKTCTINQRLVCVPIAVLSFSW